MNTTNEVDGDVSDFSNHGHRDPAGEMLVRNSTDVLRAFMECSDAVQKGILEMVEIIGDSSADEDQKAAAETTLIESLYPTYHGSSLGIDAQHYEKSERESEPELEASFDAEEATFADNLSRVMQEKGMTQADLAAKIGVGQPAIANMIARQCRPQRRTLAKIAKALDMDAQSLWPSVGS